MPNLDEKISTLLNLCGQHLEQGVAFVPLDSHRQLRTGPNFCRFCRVCLQCTALGSNCRQSIGSAAYQSWVSGEPYYYRCWLGLNSFVIAVARRDRLAGAVTFGGFYYAGTQEEDAAQLRRVLRPHRSHVPEQMWAALDRIITTTPNMLRGMAGFVYESLFSVGINSAEDFGRHHALYSLQRRVAEKIQDQPAAHPPRSDMLDILGTLIPALRDRQRDKVMVLLDEFFCRLMLHHQTRLDGAKAQVVMLLSVLMQEGVTGQSRIPFQAARARQALEMRELDSIQDATELCYWTFTKVNDWFEIQERSNTARPSAADRILRWLNQHFWEKVTLEVAAEDLGMSVSSIVKTTRNETGKSFHHHLQEIRVSEAKHLLATEGVPLAEIAERCGFTDQSHFTHVFRRELNLTPGEFRKTLNWVSEQL